MQVKFSFLFLFTLLSAFSCQETLPKEQTDITKNITDIDSAWEITVQKPTNNNFFEYSRRIRQFSQTNLDTNKSNIHINRLFEYSKKQKNIYIQNLAEQNKSMQQFIIGNFNESRYWSKRALQSALNDKEIDILDVYHLIGLSYYSPRLVADSVTKYWKLGYKTAAEQNDNYRIYFFANNLGSLFYSLNMYNISRQFFIKALEKAKELNNITPTLVNNIINALYYEKDEAEAIKYFEEYRELLMVDPDKFENQPIYLNRIHINQTLNNLLISDSLLRKVEFENLHKAYKAHYISLCIEQYILTGEKYFINDTIIAEAHNGGWKIIDNILIDDTILKDKELNFIWDILALSIEKDLEKKQLDFQSLKPLKWLIKKYKNSDPVKYNRYSNIYTEIAIEQTPTSVELNHYVSELSSVDNLFNQISKRNQTIEAKNSDIQNLIFGLTMVGTILVLSILYFRIRIQLKKKKEQYLEQEKNILQRENNTNRRIIEFSKELIGFNKKIKSELDSMNFKVDNAEFLQKLRSDILGFISVNIEKLPKAYDHRFENNEVTTVDNDEKWNTLNKTEKRIYSLFNEDFKANEIARMLGVSTQYVYNTKAKLKRNGFELN